MKISLCFTHPRGILGVYDFLLSDESNRSYIKNCPGYSRYHCSGPVFLLHLKYGYFSYKNAWIHYKRPLFTPRSHVMHILLWMCALYLTCFGQLVPSTAMITLGIARTFLITFTFTFMHLADAFIQSDLHCIQVTVLHLISSCFPWESNP